MWKYILIIAFLLFAIREINLMNDSLYIAPDTHKVIAQDKTVIGKVVQIVEKKIEKSEENRNTEHAPANKSISRTGTPHAPKAAKEAKEKLPNLSAIEREANASKNLQALERKLRLRKTATSAPESAATTPAEPKPTPKPQTEPKHAAKPIVQPKPTPARPYPDHFKSAEERVRQILREMHARP